MNTTAAATFVLLLLVALALVGALTVARLIVDRLSRWFSRTELDLSSLEAYERARAATRHPSARGES